MARMAIAAIKQKELRWKRQGVGEGHPQTQIWIDSCTWTRIQNTVKDVSRLLRPLQSILEGA